MHKIGILSDTHGLLRPEVLDVLAGCEAILHGGDINRQEILDDLGKIAPVSVVRGNNDHEWAEGMPETLDLSVCGLRIFIVHNKKFLPKDLSAYDLVIYGHSHKYEDKILDGIHFLNPGSCGPRRFNQEITLAILWVEDAPAAGHEAQSENKPENISENISESISENMPVPSNGKLQSRIPGTRIYRIEKILIPNTAKKPAAKLPDREALVKMLPAIMQEVDAGKNPAQIAGKHKIPEELAQEITRMYLTHPGVDIAGILRRLGMN